jgi:carboxyl-terminal processing protease
MLKRILSIALGIGLGALMALGVTRVALLLGFWPGAEAYRTSQYLREVLEMVHREYIDPDAVALPELTAAALRGMVADLDPHSAFLPARDYARMQEDIHNEFGGIGVQVERRQDRVVVVAPIAGTPGERAGIRRGDEIVEVEGTDMTGRPLDEVVRTMRGRPGTSVSITFWRPDPGRRFEVNVTREIIKVESVRLVRLLEDDIGYLQLAQFAERTGEEFARAVTDLQSRGARALVVDLRNNPGGLMSQAVAVAEQFFSRGELIVYTQGRDPGSRQDYRARRREPLVQMPVAILLNAGSASASEVVAGALQDTGRAVVVGERSFGKGSVQSVFRLRHGEGMRLTTAHYFTPGGATLHERGVIPDVELVMTPEEDAQLALQRARDDIDDPAAFAERFGFEVIADRQLDAALAVLRAEALVRARSVLAAAPAPAGDRG